MGARDLSVIETPPRNRLPVYTEIIEWDLRKIEEVIGYEVERGGQVYFVTDKVAGIEKMQMDLKMLMPTVKFGIAHGQMTTSELEKAMENFIKRKYDVLIATKIVESGLDIPNANTMLINRPDNFGLAELYQLRGRVGRSNKQAYCYLIIPPAKTLSPNSLRRLQAIEEFTELGSGLQLAMRDMEIRGAGNLLGPEQSGFINEIGFELFHKILDETVIELRESEFRELFEHDSRYTRKTFENENVEIEIDSEALIPSSYIDSDTERFHFYKLLYKIKENSELKDVISEMTDRFGKYPKQVEDLLFVVKMRVAAIPIGLEKVIINGNNITMEFPDECRKEYYDKVFPEIMEYLKQVERIQFRQDKGKIKVDYLSSGRNDALELIWKLKKTVDIIEF
jgi:transcription-repair coupling factor (superfamily II helicase)